MRATETISVQTQATEVDCDPGTNTFICGNVFGRGKNDGVPRNIPISPRPPPPRHHPLHPPQCRPLLSFALPLSLLTASRSRSLRCFLLSGCRRREQLAEFCAVPPLQADNLDEGWCGADVCMITCGAVSFVCCKRMCEMYLFPSRLVRGYVPRCVSRACIQLSRILQRQRRFTFSGRAHKSCPQLSHLHHWLALLVCRTSSMSAAVASARLSSWRASPPSPATSRTRPIPSPTPRRCVWQSRRSGR